MSKLTYSEQLKHPNWQRKRLEMLDAANFKCQQCGTSEVTLHVHHKQYIKGRQVWEYENSGLVVLCEHCHAEVHETEDKFKDFVAQLPAYGSCSLDEILPLAAGYCHGWQGLDFHEQYRSSPDEFMIGRLAFVLQFACTMNDFLEIHGLLSTRSHAKKKKAIKAFIEILKGDANA